jgi:thiamine biosynthesis protein ThiS
LYLALVPTMTLTINGEPRSFDNLSTLATLIDVLNLKGDRVAVELNREIVSRTQWEATPIKDGDKLEIVHFVGGGNDTLPAAPELEAEN